MNAQVAGADLPPSAIPGAVSVLVPLYRHEGTVEEALDSILLSDCSRIELIISDDASPDRSFHRAQAWLQRHRDRFLHARAIRQARNLGITGNLNALIGAARGEYITLLASDDRLTSDAIDIQRAYLETHADNDFVFANVGVIRADGTESGEVFVSERRAAALQHHACAVIDIVFNWDLPWARLFARRAAFLEFGGYIAEHSFEDRWCALKIVESGRFGYLHRVVHLYRQRTAGNGTAGLEMARVIADLHDVERRLARESTGLLRLLLQMRSRSFRAARSGPADRLLWVSVRRSMTAAHKALIGYRSPL